MDRPDSARRLLLVHAHPDDESIGTGATIARYAAEGAQVTLVTCTLGELGEVIPPELAHLATGGDRLGEHRITELAAACAALGIGDQRFLGGPGRWRDSGMMGLPSNDDPDCFWQADLATAAAELAEVILEVRPQVLVTYDANGFYGHPDHIQAHRVCRCSDHPGRSAVAGRQVLRHRDAAVGGRGHGRGPLRALRARRAGHHRDRRRCLPGGQDRRDARARHADRGGLGRFALSTGAGSHCSPRSTTRCWPGGTLHSPGTPRTPMALEPPGAPMAPGRKPAGPIARAEGPPARCRGPGNTTSSPGWMDGESWWPC